MAQTIDYVEFPTDVIRSITFPRKPDDGTSCGGETPAPPFCNTYGYAKGGGGNPEGPFAGNGGNTGGGGVVTTCLPDTRPCWTSEDRSSWGCVDNRFDCTSGEIGYIPGGPQDPNYPGRSVPARSGCKCPSATDAISPAPLAGNLSPAPFVGGFSMYGMNGTAIPGFGNAIGDEGQLRTPGGPSAGTAPDNQDAMFLFLTAQEINFTTQYLTDLAGAPGTPGLTWGVDMALGGTVKFLSPTFCFIDSQIVDSYEVTCYPGAGDPGGLGISHPRDDGIAMSKPSTTVMSGAGTWFYKMHWASYLWRGTGLGHGSMIDGGNEHDPDTPGPIYLWWTSSPGAYFMGGGVGGESYTWTVKANCFGLYDAYLEEGIISPSISPDEYVDKYLIPYQQYVERQRMQRLGRLSRRVKG